MPWFDTPVTHPQGKWGLHWTMELNNPGTIKNCFAKKYFFYEISIFDSLKIKSLRENAILHPIIILWSDLMQPMMTAFSIIILNWWNWQRSMVLFWIGMENLAQMVISIRLVFTRASVRRLRVSWVEGDSSKILIKRHFDISRLLTLWIHNLS